MKASDFDLADPALTAYLAECEKRLRFTEFSPEIAYLLGEFLRQRFTRLYEPSQALYIQIRGFPARLGCPSVLFVAVAGNPDRLGAGIAYQIEGKARVVEHHGASTYSATAFAAMMGWPTEKMGLFKPDQY